MAATDYTILAGLFNLYFAKKLKGDKISEDRRVITDNEKPIFGHISGKRSNTHWICFQKGGEV